MFPIEKHRTCAPYGMIFDDDYCCCRFCGTQWKLGQWQWTLLDGAPKGKAPTRSTATRAKRTGKPAWKSKRGGTPRAAQPKKWT